MSSVIHVFLAGEGKNELGGRIGPPAFHNPDKRGVLEAILRKIRENGWEVGGAVEWRRIRKFKARGQINEEARAVLGAALDAREANCHVLAFCRDRDKDETRHDAIEEGIRQVFQNNGANLDVIGGVAVPTLEGWILAFLTHRKTDSLSPTRAQENLIAAGVPAKDTDVMVAVVDEAQLHAVPEDAESLRRWLDRAREVMNRRCP